jgi:DNA helicase II / ATP-dependent DNA helicase PcrA
MPAANEISDEEISRAAQLLFGPTGTFDDERRAFIRRLDTLDLHAVPGSGKTTALLAKLIALENRLPLANGAGILVVSHTNAAVDEIRSAIARHCPRLFGPPNFVGTIQSFVDQFLALPYYGRVFGRRPVRIHDNLHLERAAAFMKCTIKDFTPQELKNARFFLSATQCAGDLRLNFVGGTTAINSRRSWKPIVVKKPGKGPGWSPEECDRVAAWLRGFKLQIMQEGYLCFDDAYMLAERYLEVLPRIAAILRLRFPHVFVDEMQDMNARQHDLLEQLFFNPACAYQRIGDRNQAIHGEREAGAGDHWVSRAPSLTLTKSLRLSGPTAAVVSGFALHSPGLKIEGTNSAVLKPRMLLYQDDTAQAVLGRFSQIVRAEIDAGRIPLDHRAKFRAIAWNTTWSDTESSQGKFRLVNFCPQFVRTAGIGRTEHSCLEAALRDCFQSASSMRTRELGMLGVFLRILRLQGLRSPGFNTHFTRASLLTHLRENHADYSDLFRLLRLRWAVTAANGNFDAVLAEIRGHVPEFLTQFKDLPKQATTDYLSTPATAQTAPAVPTGNIVRMHDFDIELASVHAVKGQTHTATLYFESAFQVDGTGAAAKSYESQRLAGQFLGQPFPASPAIRVQQSAKMIYVGFSRPTHLLCFAVHKQRFDAHLSAVAGKTWDIIDLG